MDESESRVEYTRLPGAGWRRRGGCLAATWVRCRLWLGPDHVLSVESAGGYVESYKRFYFRDVQAFVIRRTDWAQVWAVVFGVSGGLLALGAFLAISPIWRATFGVAASLLLVGLLVNLLRGPSCVCHIVTAVQTDELAPLKRVRVSQRVIARLRAAIEQTQGALEPVRPLSDTETSGGAVGGPERPVASEPLGAPPGSEPAENRGTGE